MRPTTTSRLRASIMQKQSFLVIAPFISTNLASFAAQPLHNANKTPTFHSCPNLKTLNFASFAPPSSSETANTCEALTAGALIRRFALKDAPGNHTEPREAPDPTLPES